ncbi:MAG: anaerobic ribonucleoside-triphosphate reductase activating protein [Oscillospiraceae bacterium]|nr:anaerobic ribonucleoside-triphosphate reductase activating protein [Oscillospiraceae bacterium]MCI9551173.1 anaerobic ribonucleoside-triphosphate reductase activating protein [Oscillospiraceae bacterium]
MNFAAIKWADVANGPGVRVSLFVSGCTHRCPGCFNEEAWDFGYGQPFTEVQEDKILAALVPAHIKGLSLLGGEPFEPDNQRALLPFLRRVKEVCPDKEVWCYSGYTLDGELWRDSRARCQYTDEMLSLIDVLVDGPFVEAKKDLNLRFRGSSNQRILNVPASLKAHTPVLWDGDMTIQSIPFS